ncbi:TIGR01621 family pseudouridine synthase [Marinobacterium sp. YM272]|uniref:TIGR01621 family pseudouridine synthase n=1 Tax=Marinobacterium sp. YM272 TaxID=3421654 RepID=UPI003D7F7F60
MYKILAETDGFLVIDKAPGVSVHRDQEAVGLVMQVERDRNEKLWLVHRLDRMTSGVMLLARSAEVCNRLAELFRNQQVEKYYLALSDKKPTKKQGQVIGDMERGRRGSWKLLRSRSNPALTEFYSCSAGPGLRLFLCRPGTGRTHQIRVALKSVGAPIIGDPIYHEVVEPAPDRGYLHAWQLCFSLDGCEYCYRSDPQCGELFRGAGVLDALNDWADPSAMKWRLAGKRNPPAV